MKNGMQEKRIDTKSAMRHKTSQFSYGQKRVQLTAEEYARRIRSTKKLSVMSR